MMCRKHRSMHAGKAQSRALRCYSVLHGPIFHSDPWCRACLKGLLGSRPSSCMAYKMRRCTGLRPSRTSGRARPTITDMAYCASAHRGHAGQICKLLAHNWHLHVIKVSSFIMRGGLKCDECKVALCYLPNVSVHSSACSIYDALDGAVSYSYTLHYPTRAHVQDTPPGRTAPSRPAARCLSHAARCPRRRRRQPGRPLQPRPAVRRAAARRWCAGTQSHSRCCASPRC